MCPQQFVNLRIQWNTGSLDKISYDFLCHIISSRLLFVEAIPRLLASTSCTQTSGCGRVLGVVSSVIIVEDNSGFPGDNLKDESPLSAYRLSRDG
jgi:hypothetical protein